MSRAPVMGTFGTILAAGALLYLAVLALMYALQERLLFLPGIPGRALEATPAAIGLRFEAVTIAAADGVQLSGWWVPAAQPGLTLIHFHGNAGNISHRLELLEIFHQLGFSVLLFDYRGYGASEGSAGEEGVYLDAGAVWRYVTERRGVAPQKIVLHGQSLGAAVAAWLAARQQPAALIVESGFTSVPELAADLYWWLPVRYLARLKFDTKEALGRVRCPVLVIHSRNDEIIPYGHAQRLFEAAPGPKRMLTISGDHNAGFWLSREAYARGIGGFLGEPAR
jgi:hypothetical protein